VFAQSDPLEYCFGPANFYAYSGNNPMNFGDPSGHLLTATGDHWSTAGRSAATAATAFGTVAGGTFVLANAISETIEKALAVDSMSSAPGSPNAPDPCRQWRRLIQEHQDKLEQYLRDPLGMDNQGTLMNAPNVLIKMSVMLGRVSVLIKAIHRHERNLRQCERDNGLR